MGAVLIGAGDRIRRVDRHAAGGLRRRRQVRILGGGERDAVGVRDLDRIPDAGLRGAGGDHDHGHGGDDDHGEQSAETGLESTLAALALTVRLLLCHPPLAGFFLLLLARGHGRSNATEELRNNAPNEQDSDDEGRDAASERDHRGEQPETNVAGVHQPSAWSMITAVNGVPPGGAIWYPRLHLPTITSAGADRE